MEIEWLILADAAQLSGGKLYLLGGGWETLIVNTPFPLMQTCAVAASFRVPWHETNRPFPLEIAIETEDGTPLPGGRLDGTVELGRPAGAPPGQDQRAQITAQFHLTFARPGGYVLVARVAGQEQRVPFNVLPGPLMPRHAG